MLILNLDSPQWNFHIVATVQQQLAEMFKYSFVYVSSQPSFLSGSYSYLFVSDTVHPMRSPVDWDAWRLFGVYSHYYSPDVHYSSFLLPADLSRRVSMAGQLKDVPRFSAAEDVHAPWPRADAVPPKRLEPASLDSSVDGEAEADSESDL